MNNDLHTNISCSVSQCKFNCRKGEEGYCVKDGGIKVGTHEANPSAPECTDCLSFKCR